MVVLGSEWSVMDRSVLSGRGGTRVMKLVVMGVMFLNYLFSVFVFCILSYLILHFQLFGRVKSTKY